MLTEEWQFIAFELSIIHGSIANRVPRGDTKKSPNPESRMLGKESTSSTKQFALKFYLATARHCILKEREDNGILKTIQMHQQSDSPASAESRCLESSSPTPQIRPLRFGAFLQKIQKSSRMKQSPTWDAGKMVAAPVARDVAAP